MKHAVCLAGSILCLAACNKGPEVDLHNASANQVTEAVQHSAAMSSDTLIDPGLWESKVTVQDMSIPGMPPQYAEKMKQTLAEHRNDTNRHCVTEADVKKPKVGFFGADKSCRYDHFTMGGGKIDIQMACKQENLIQITKLAGSYTPTTYSLDMSSVGTGPQQGMTMKMHVDAKRIGLCTAKDG